MTAHLSPSNICFANFCLEISSFYFNIKIYDFLYSSCDKKILEWAYFDRIWNLTFIIIQTLKSVSSLVNCKTDTHFILNEIFFYRKQARRRSINPKRRGLTKSQREHRYHSTRGVNLPTSSGTPGPPGKQGPRVSCGFFSRVTVISI